MENKHYTSTVKLWIKAIALAVVISFMWGQVAWAGPCEFYSLRPLAADEKIKKGDDESKWQNLKREISKRIEAVFKPENFGYYGLLRDDRSAIVMRDEDFGEDDRRIRLDITLSRTQDENGLFEGGYSCLEGAWIIRNWLEDSGVEPEVWAGKAGIWDIHYYVKTVDGTKFSATPDISHIDGEIEDSRHISEVTAEDLYKMHRSRVPIDEGFAPMSWKKIDENAALLVSGGIDIGLLLDRYEPQEFTISFHYDIRFFKNGKTCGSIEVIAKISKDRLLEVQGRLRGKEPKNIIDELKTIGIEVETRISYDALGGSERGLIATEKEETIDVLYFLITKLDTGIVSRFSMPSLRGLDREGVKENNLMTQI